jgi:two-component system, OmpR family, phosphate regulon sensor histidine kinase PhoR
MTFTKSLFPKFLLAAAVLIGITVAGLDIYITNYLLDREMQQVRQRLAVNASLAQMDLDRAPADQLQSWASEIARRAQARVTLIGQDGRVLADSESDASTMENHSGRPEFLQALKGKAGQDIRRSATLNQDFLYYAIPVVSAGNVAGLRLAMPLERLTRATSDIRQRLAWTSVLVLLAALGIAWVMSRRFSSRVERLEAFAGRIADRQPVEPLKVDSLDELGSLGNSLNRMASQFGEFVEKLEAEARSRDTILSSMAEGVLATDAEMRLTFCNPAFARAMGLAYPVIGHPPLAMLVRDAALLSLLTKVITTNQAHNDQLRLTIPDARLFIVHAVPYGAERGSEGQTGALAIFHDITDIERLERVRRDFVSNASHELRTPISAIQGYVETLLDGAMDDPKHSRRFLETISANAIRLKDITADLLVLSELEAGSTQLNEVFPLRAAVESAIRTAGPEAVARHVALVQQGIADVHILGSRLRLEQAMINLLTNGVKFNHEGGSVVVAATYGAGGAGKQAVEIRVADTGIGIPPQDLPRIFERFYRVDKARSRDVGGTGLGLSIVKHAVETLGGTVRVVSDLGSGSTFVITLPIAPKPA